MSNIGNKTKLFLYPLFNKILLAGARKAEAQGVIIKLYDIATCLSAAINIKACTALAWYGKIAGGRGDGIGNAWGIRQFGFFRTKMFHHHTIYHVQGMAGIICSYPCTGNKQLDVVNIQMVFIALLRKTFYGKQ